MTKSCRWSGGLEAPSSCAHLSGPAAAGAQVHRLADLGVCNRLIFKHNCRGDGGDHSYQVLQGHLQPQTPPSGTPGWWLRAQTGMACWKEVKARGTSGLDLLTAGDLQAG